jgi:hypothetical protein
MHRQVKLADPGPAPLERLPLDPATSEPDLANLTDELRSRQIRAPKEKKKFE